MARPKPSPEPIIGAVNRVSPVMAEQPKRLPISKKLPWSTTASITGHMRYTLRRSRGAAENSASSRRSGSSEYRRRWLALTGTVMVEAAWGMAETHACDTFTTGMQEGGRDLATLPLGQEGEIVVRSPSQLKA